MDSDSDKDRVLVETELSDGFNRFFNQMPFERNLHQKLLKSDVVNTGLLKRLINFRFVRSN